MDLHPTAKTYPYVTRLFLDVEPSGNPIARGAVLYRRGTEQGTLWFEAPEPFDSLADAWADLLTDFLNYIGEQGVLF